MAEHRGFKLVRSRKRTPGIGDYGKFGLTDAAGKAVLGFGDAGLTASADEISDYLRGGAVSSWKLSAESASDRPPPKKKSTAVSPQDEEAPVRQRDRAAAAEKPRVVRKPADRPPRETPVLRLVPTKEPEPTPPPKLKLRAAKPADIEQIAALLGELKEPPARKDIEANLQSLRKAKAGFIVAEQAAIVGCASWAVVPTVQHGPVGRLTLLLVERDHRLRGIGRALVEAAERALATNGCRQIEAMSDIMVANAHNFFRSLKFEQKSYRFVRFLPPG